MSMYYDRNGEPMALMEWAKTFEDSEGRRVAYTEIRKDLTVSTVWLGLDHAFGGGPPLIFETMVFGGPFDEEMRRYHTEEEAAAGHELVVERVRKAVEP